MSFKKEERAYLDTLSPEQELIYWQTEAAREQAEQRSHVGITVFSVILIVFALWVGYHVVHAEATRNDQPVSCQILGGSWDAWNGWVCN